MNKKVPFTLADIEQLATTTSFERGEDYYNDGSVQKIIRTGNHFEARVMGSERYHVSLDIDEENTLDFDCSCPYDYDGICKHCVAFGLAIIDGDYTETAANTSNSKITHPEFEVLYKEAETTQKLSFLKQLLDRDTQLQNQFAAFIQTRDKATDPQTIVDIDEIATAIYEDLSAVDFDDVMENHFRYSDYGMDEGSEDVAYQHIDEILTPYKQKATSLLQRGNLTDAMGVLLAIYEGTQDLPEPDENYGLFDNDYSDKASEHVQPYIKEFAQEANRIIKTDSQTTQMFDLFFDRYNQVKKKKNNPIVYNTKHFEYLFIHLINNSNIANYAYEQIQQHKAHTQELAFVLLHIATQNQNDELWLKTAETYALNEHEIAKQLLNKYKQTGDKTKFLSLASDAFTKWNNHFDIYVIENVAPDDNHDLYVAALYHATKYYSKIEYYKLLRQHISPEEKELFIKKMQNSYNQLFCIEIFEVEQRYDDILKIVHKIDDYSLPKAITPILNIFQQECFTIIKNKCNQYVTSPKRNRGTYQYMVQLLELMKKIETHQEQCTLYIKSLPSNRLPALKDELRRAGLL